jgi:hypothetical protein
MLQIPYDASRSALMNPGLREPVFGRDAPPPPTLAALCAECARLAYLHFERDTAAQRRLVDALAAMGLSDWQGFSDAATGTQAYAAIITRTGQPLVAFRGTEPDQITDLGIDLIATLVNWPGGGRVHAGFARAFDSVQRPLAAWLARSGSAAPPVFTGHSLGAALATLAASTWRSSLHFTFGSPRVGDSEFVATIDLATATRFVNCCDIVTRLPPITPGLYAEAGPMTYIDRNGVVQADLSEGAVAEDGNQARRDYLIHDAWVNGNVWARDLADHSPINYVRALL